MMTWGDAYVTVTLLAILFTPIVLWLGWIEHRDERRRNRGYLSINRPLDYTEARALAARWRALPRPSECPPGTVQNPTDPSPTPRLRHLIEDGIHQQDRAAKLRAEADWEAQR